MRAAGIEDGDTDARILVCAACRIDHAGLIREPDAPLEEGAARLTHFLARRLAREPVSRILGRRPFWGLPFIITPAVLDPRPETEGVVGSALDALGGRRDAVVRVLDLGTGSGAILCALLHELPNAFGVGIDRSIEACRVARDNVRALDLSERAAVICGNWADALEGRFDVVVSNPPYIVRGELSALHPEVRDHDPATALDGGPDGLEAYGAIIPLLENQIVDGGAVVFECGWNAGAGVADLLRASGFGGVMVYRDLAGLERVVVGTKRRSSLLT